MSGKVRLESDSIALALDPENALFSLEPRAGNAPHILDAHFSVRYRLGQAWHRLGEDVPGEAGELEEIGHPLGRLRVRTLGFPANRHGLQLHLRFAVDPAQPFIAWQMSIGHRGSAPVRLGRLELLRVGFATADQAGPRRAGRQYRRGEFRFPQDDAFPGFFSNGWGSWNHTGAFGLTDRFRRTRFGPFTRPMRVNPGTPQPGMAGHFASDMFGVLGDRVHRGGILLGFLSQMKHFGSLEALVDPVTPALSLWANGDETRLDPGGTAETDWACCFPIHLDTPDPLGPYLEAVAEVSGLALPLSGPVPTGWCSWYRYGQEIDAAVLLANLARAAELRAAAPLEVFQVDDGWQAAVGDWSDFAPGIPGGPRALAPEIAARGFEPGLWLAPFIVHPGAALAADHPDWLLRGRTGLPVNAGFVWNTFTRALDISRPEVLDHVLGAVRQGVDWGFPYLKLDFLYAGALAGRRADPTRTRAEILREAFLRIRAAVGPETRLIG